MFHTIMSVVYLLMLLFLVSIVCFFSAVVEFACSQDLFLVFSFCLLFQLVQSGTGILIKQTFNP